MRGCLGGSVSKRVSESVCVCMCVRVCVCACARERLGGWSGELVGLQNYWVRVASEQHEQACICLCVNV